MGLITQGFHSVCTFTSENHKQHEEKYVIPELTHLGVFLISSLNIILRVKHKPKCLISPSELVVAISFP